MEKRIRIWNTLSGKKEKIPARRGKPIRLFVCGPTVYDLTHIGHARTYVFFDFFVKYLRMKGLPVQYIQNITDVDDKIIRRAKEEGKEPLTFSKALTKSYLADIKRFGVDTVDTYAPSTKFIPEIVGQVEQLIKKGVAYKIEGDGYYFDIARFPGYGKLSRRNVAQAEDSVSRIDDSIGKHNKGDFCLWKFSKPGEPAWNTPLGKGRPGWHIEDTATSEHFFGPQYDIHGGGLDLKFPHHEAEIAQQEAASGKVPFVKLWMHAGILTVNGEKMSKSLGNFITVAQFLEKHSPEAFRFIIFSHHYRMPLDYSDELAGTATQTLEGVRMLLGRIIFAQNSLAHAGKKAISLSRHAREFERALLDDINTPQALAAIFSAIRDFQPHIWNLKKTSLAAFEKFVREHFGTFGITFSMPVIPPQAQTYAEEREKARRNQQFVQSDALRRRLHALGYVVEDTPNGSFVWPKKVQQG